MSKFIEIVIYILAAIGLASLVKHIHTLHSKKGCCLCGKHKPEEKEEEKEENRTGSRYGSNPVKYN